GGAWQVRYRPAQDLRHEAPALCPARADEASDPRLFRADGYFSVRPSGRVTFGVSAYNREIVEEIQEWCVVQTGVSRTSLVSSRSNWHYRQYANHEVETLAALLYDTANVYLERKHAIAQLIMRRSPATAAIIGALSVAP